MTSFSPLGHAPAPTWALVLFATCAAWALRVWGGYPSAPSDEHNWAQIALAVQQGVDWPISGPLHFEATQVMARMFALNPAEALAVLGVLSVPAVLAIYVLAYRWLGFRQAAWPLLALSLSTYFWAPLLESRPQQWGQALALLCVVGVWRLLIQNQYQQFSANKQVLCWTLGGLVFGLLTWTHILSGAIALGLCLTLGLLMLALRQTQWQRLLHMLAAASPGIMLLFWPQGPYHAMWQDILHTQLLVHPKEVLVLVTAGLIGALALVLVVRQYAAITIARLLRIYDTSTQLCTHGLTVFMMAALAAQALLLPPDAWHRYDNSVLQFLLFQLGNISFLWLVLRGLQSARQAYRVEPLAQWSGTLMLTSSAAILGTMVLALSFFLLHTNWLLRFVNYSILLTAPFAALALLQLPWRKAALPILGVQLPLTLSVAARQNWLFG